MDRMAGDGCVAMRWVFACWGLAGRMVVGMQGWGLGGVEVGVGEGLDKRNAPQPELGDVTYFTGRTCCVRCPLFFGLCDGGGGDYRRPRTVAAGGARCPVLGANPVDVPCFCIQVAMRVFGVRRGYQGDTSPLARGAAGVPQLHFVVDDSRAVRCEAISIKHTISISINDVRSLPRELD